MKLLRYIALSAIITSAAAFVACSDVEYPQTPDVPMVGNLAYSLDGRTVTLTWDAPQGATGFQVLRNSQLIETLPAGTTTYSLKRQTTGTELAFTVKTVYDDLVSTGTTVRLTIEAIPLKVALLLPCSSIDELTDDDEIASANWFKTTYAENGEIITPADIASLSPDEYSVVWINIDRVGLQAGWRNLPQALVSDEAIEAMTEYITEGGNLFLTKHATQLAATYGIIDESYAPGIFGSGEGGSGSDNWSTNAYIGMTYDHRGHDIFKGMATIPDFGHETFALEGPGWREDHNCCWDLNSYGFDGNPNTVVNFETATNSTVLATWAHVVDFAVAGIVEFHATSDRLGRCLAIGLSAYEFNQNTGNPFQDNTELLTKNCIDYLNK